MPSPAALESRRTPRAPFPRPPARQPRDRGAGGRGWFYAGLAAAALAAGAASLALAAAPSYDPWSWVVWGREVLHGGLVTVGGPTWKPLPVLFTTVFAAFGSAAPDLWLVVARAAGILGLALTGVLAVRLAPRAARAPAAALSAALALAGVLLLAGYLDSVASGESEGLLLAAVTLAILRHLDGAPRQAFVLGLAAALIRPETWPFLILYAVPLWRRDPAARAMIAAGLALIPALWFGPELWGAHSVLRGVQWAQHPRPGSPAFAHCPFCAELTGHAWPLAIAPVRLGVVLLAALGLTTAAGRRPPAAAATVGALALAWIVEEAVLTQTGFSGSDRYLIVPVALLIALAAAGWGGAVTAAATATRPRLGMARSRLGTARSRLGPTAVLTTLVVTAILAGGELANLATTVARQRAGARLRTDLAAVVAAAGGTRRLLACGAVQTNPSDAPLVAWTLGVPLLATESARGDVVIRSGDLASSTPAPAAPRQQAGYRIAARAGTVTIYVRCPR